MFVLRRAAPTGTFRAHRSDRVPPSAFPVAAVMLSAVLALFAWVPPATATIESMPVRVRIAGTPPRAEKGRTVRTTLELSVGRTTMVENLRLEGDGWAGRIVSVRPSTFALTQAAPVRLEVEATPADANARLVVAFEVDGVTYRQPFDLSPGTTAAREGLPLREVVATAPNHLPLPAGYGAGLPPPGEPVTAEERRARAATRVAREFSATARTIRVHGRIVYRHAELGVQIGADGVTVDAWDWQPTGSRYIWSAVTDRWGNFEILFPWADPADPDPDLILTFGSVNGYTRVSPEGTDYPYYWVTAPVLDFAGGDIEYPGLTPLDEGTHAVLHILTDLMRDRRWYESQGITTLPHVTARWPVSEGAVSHYHPDLIEIHIRPGANSPEWSEATHAHEFGHHFMYTLSRAIHTTYCNEPYRCDDDPANSVCGHCAWCNENQFEQWSEGVPDWFGHVQPASYAAVYGRAAWDIENWEFVARCTDPGYGVWDPPLNVEGFCAAVLTDLADYDNERDVNGLANGTDDLALGTYPIFQVLVLDKPALFTDFVYNFSLRNPSLVERFWATLANNQINLDTGAPGVATSVHPVGHVIGVGSADNTVNFTWTRAIDDFSGVGGYAMSLTNAAADPGYVQNLSDTTAFTTAWLEPGNWHMNLRAVDRAGNWSAAYVSCGPLVILPPGLADLQPSLPIGWGEMLVPRPAADATSGSVPKPTSLLPGNQNSTWWNAAGRNYSFTPISGSTRTTLYVDGVPADSVDFASFDGQQVRMKLNGGPLQVRGGRHTFAVMWDAKRVLAEALEDNNVRGRQWTWQPLTVAVDQVVSRPAPPHPTGGGSMLPLGIPYHNCDGLRMIVGTGTGYWHAMVLSPELATGSISANLHVATYSPDTGFATPRARCAYGQGVTNAVLVNRHRVGGTMAWDVGAEMEFQSPSGYTARHIQSTTVALGDSLVVTIPAGEHVKLFELQPAGADTGWVSVRATLLAGNGPVVVAWFDDEFQAGTLWDYADVKVLVDSLETQVIDEEVDGYGGRCIALSRDMKDGNRPLTVRLQFERTRPDVRVDMAAPFYSPLVPSSSLLPIDDPTPAPTTLTGNATNTYLNFWAKNQSPSPTPPNVSARVSLDGDTLHWHTFPPIPANVGVLARPTEAHRVRGGRHSLTIAWDPLDQFSERSETNNVFGEQWVWSPVSMTFATALTRAAPPERMGGWTEVTSIPYGLYYNCDGLRTPSTNAGGNHDRYWVGVAAMPGDTSDVDVRLHDIEAGTQAGFRSSHATSNWGVGRSDFCLGNYNLTGFHRLDVGVLKASGAQDYTIEAVTSKFLATNPDAAFGPYSLGTGHLMHLYEAWFDAGLWVVTLEPGGTLMSIDWGLSVHPSSASYPVKSDAVADGIAYLAPPGGAERVTFTVGEPGYHAIAVWKSVSADVPLASTYTLRIGPAVLDAAGRGTPATTRFTGAWPNPARAITRLGFDLAREAHASLTVYDLRGARVRTLCDDVLPAGRHELAWDGGDEHGRRVAPGVYLVRFAGDGKQGVRRVVRL